MSSGIISFKYTSNVPVLIFDSRKFLAKQQGGYLSSLVEKSFNAFSISEETEVPANKGGEVKAPSLPSSPANSDDGYSPSPSGFLPNYSSQALNNKQNNFQLAKSDSVKDVNSYATSLIQINEYASSSQKPNFGTLNNAHYNKQQSYSPRSQMSPIGGYNQRFNSAEGIQRKRYHTAPREKHRVRASRYPKKLSLSPDDECQIYVFI